MFRDLTFVLRTTNRTPAYLSTTLDNLVRGGVKQVDIAFGAAGTVKPNQNALEALELGIARHADWIVFLEDDIDVCADFPGSVQRWLRDIEQPLTRVYSLGAPGDFPPTLPKPAYGVQAAGFYGSWGLAMRRHHAKDFAAWLADNLHHTWDDRDVGGHTGVESRGKCFDLRLAVWHKIVEPRGCILIAAPSLINHIGVSSSLDNTVGELQFAGRDYVYGA